MQSDSKLHPSTQFFGSRVSRIHPYAATVKVRAGIGAAPPHTTLSPNRCRCPFCHTSAGSESGCRLTFSNHSTVPFSTCRAK